ncbi:MAG: pantetheine-phosphate adenylyltransferase [Planctomycetota bacterium]|nr:pantetheine-phosphate adenylyltransferase [Planctomycetaceae bacterium]MDQ3331592.1 pantetheine-phosphate adenylyltransferase [Planctomycetota bacterium]
MSKPLDSRHAVCVGSFDPVTLGHADIIARGARVFDRLTVGIGINPDKRPLFSSDERIELMRQVLEPLENVTVASFDGLAVNFVRDCGAAVLLRGVRSLMDIESELTMSLTNRSLAPEIETVFLMANENYSHVSSTLIKQIARFGKDDAADRLRSFVPDPVVAPLIAKYRDGASSA